MKKRKIILILFTLTCLLALFLFPIQAFAAGFPSGLPGEGFARLDVEGFCSASDTIFTLSFSGLEPDLFYGSEFQIFSYAGTLEELLAEPNQGDFIIYSDVVPSINAASGEWQKEISINLAAGSYIAVLRGSNGVDEAWDYKAFDIILSKGEILIDSGVEGKGLTDAPGQQKPFNPNSQAAEHAGKKK